MIRSLKHKGLKKLHEQGDGSGIRPDLRQAAKQILTVLDSAGVIEDVDTPRFRLHPLVGNLRGYWSVTVRANWRIIFRFEDGGAYDVELIDYH